VDSALLARANNRLNCGRVPTAADSDVRRLRHLLIDVDPVRPSGISATDAEVDATRTVRNTVRRFLLKELDWPHAVAVTRSGNGGGLLYRLDLHNDVANTDVLRRVLVALDALFSTAAVKIDTTTFNPSRITKVIGSIAAKGDDVPERPWRLATGRFNSEPQPVPVELLEAVVALAPTPDAPRRQAPNGYGSGRDWDIRAVLSTAGIGFTEGDKGYAKVFKLDRCLTSNDHVDGACILEFPSGALAYCCHHDRCSDKGWIDVRDRLMAYSSGSGPTFAERGQNQQSASPPGGQTRAGDETMASRTPPQAPDWPGLDPAALYGLAGEVVRAVDPETEGDPVATLVNYLLMVGSAIGGTPHARVGDRRHHANEFAVLVGETSKGRKGTSHDAPHAIVGAADRFWDWRVQGGLSSGEGLVWAVRDPIEGEKKGQPVVLDHGVDDKRLLVVEEEFTAVCKVATREGNTLSETLRRAWDGKPLGNLTKNSPARCGTPHISVLAHVTRTELLRVLDSTDAANGFGNRFLWVCVRRSKFLPEGGRLPDAQRAALVAATHEVVTGARRIGEVRRNDDARELWAEIYEGLSSPGTGLFGAMTDRAEAHVLRLSLLYALLDLSAVITAEHLRAALALWDYCAASARHIFGDALGDPAADRVLVTLRSSGPLDRTQLNELFGRHLSGTRLDRALEVLLRAGKARTWTEATGGRPRTLWAAT
jgi:hypothetical protein